MAEKTTPKTKKCPFCAETILYEARKCKHCGEMLDPILIAAAASKKEDWKPGVAAVLSLVIPGAGQIYKGQVRSGLVWLLLVAIGYICLIIPGLILHVLCIINASQKNG